ncbi:MAG: hypothetical protein D6694_06695 [Gammaproteobacteria bacterium]|nr:MAG: hypothetical protein D6694_06695 [Gammaproteobacteria bacterium]
MDILGFLSKGKACQYKGISPNVLLFYSEKHGGCHMNFFHRLLSRLGKREKALRSRYKLDFEKGRSRYGCRD